MVDRSKILTCFFTLSLICSEAYSGPKTIRMAHITMHPSLVTGLGYLGGIPPHFLRRAKGLGYTHVMAQITPSEVPSEWNKPNGTYIWGGDSTLFKTLVNAYKEVHAHGMILVPKLEISSKHTGTSWDGTNDNIVWNTGDETRVKDSIKDTVTYRMNSFANEPNGFDKTFQEVLVLINLAFQAAKSATSGFPEYQEFVHLGHGEILVQTEGQPCADIMIGSGSFLDRNAIDAIETPGSNYPIWYPGSIPPISYPEAFRRLMAQEIKRRIDQVHARIDTRTKIIIDGDPWDSQHNGRHLAKKAWGSNSCSIATMDVASLPGFTNPDSIAYIRQNLIIMPWNYSTNYREFDYDVAAAFNHLKNNGLKFMTTFCVADWGKPISHWQETEGRLDQLHELVSNANKPEYSSSVMGFNSYHFPEENTFYHVNNGLDPAYLTLNYLSYWFGVRSIIPQIGLVISP